MNVKEKLNLWIACGLRRKATPNNGRSAVIYDGANCVKV